MVTKGMHSGSGGWAVERLGFSMAVAGRELLTASDTVSLKALATGEDLTPSGGGRA